MDRETLDQLDRPADAATLPGLALGGRVERFECSAAERQLERDD